MGRQESPQLIERKGQVDTDAQETNGASKYFYNRGSYCIAANSYSLHTALFVGLTRERFLAHGLPWGTHLRTRYWGVLTL